MNPNRGGSYMNYSGWIKNEKATTNSINKNDNKYFQYAVKATLNDEEIGKKSQKISQIKSFKNKQNQEGINYLSEKDDWKKFLKNNLTIALNVLHAKIEKIYPAYVSKQNLNSGNKKNSLNDYKRGRMEIYCSIKNYLHY